MVAGAAGALGRHVVRTATDRGYKVRALVRRTNIRNLPKGVDLRRADARFISELDDVCTGVDIVFSSLGASVLPGRGKGRRSYFAVDTLANRNLITAASAAGVRKFVYVSVACRDSLAKLAYVRAHERVVDLLLECEMEHLVIRPTGFYSAFGSLLPMASKGLVPIIGDGTAKTNPIDDAELAGLSIEALEGDQDELELGGPEVLTRREIVDEAFRAIGREPKVIQVPAVAARLLGHLLWPINPRMSQLTQFVAAVSTRDVVAPSVGSLRLRDHFAKLVA